MIFFNVLLRFERHFLYFKEYFKQIVLYKAFKKYGIEHFYIEEIEEVENDLLDEREKYWINKENSLVPNGYNIDKGGQGQHNTKPVD